MTFVIYQKINLSSQLTKYFCDKNRFFKIILMILALSFLNSCGFQVIYKNNPDKTELNYEERLASIKILAKRKRIDQKLESNLKEALNPNKIQVDKKYLLDVMLTKSIAGTIINPTGSSGRNKVTLTANYKLIRILDDELISTGNATVKDDFNVDNKRFANYVAQEEIELNLTQLIAQNIRNSLINDLIMESKN